MGRAFVFFFFAENPWKRVLQGRECQSSPVVWRAKEDVFRSGFYSGAENDEFVKQMEKIRRAVRERGLATRRSLNRQRRFRTNKAVKRQGALPQTNLFSLYIR